MWLERWPQLLEDLSGEDNARAQRAGEALLAQGGRALPLILETLPQAPVGARRRLVFLAGEIGRSCRDRQPARSALRVSLCDEDWKVRRNAAVGLGKLGRDEAAAGAVLERLEEEADGRVRHSLLLAFGHAAASQALAARFESREFDADEQAAAQKARDTLRARFGGVAAVAPSTMLGEEALLELWCRWGIAGLVREEAEEHNLSAAVIAPDRVRLKSPAALSALQRIRAALYPVLVYSSKSLGIDARTLGKEFFASAVAREIVRLTGSASRYRATLPTHFAAEGKRPWIEEFAASDGNSSLQNAATGYEWELIVRRAGNHSVIGARPVAASDDRFSYRKQDRPASLHPTLAAAAARYYRAEGQAVILDPFCGSGSLLAECALRGPYARLMGWDIDSAAIDAARVNLHGFSHVTLVCADMRSASRPRGLTAIVSNPPYGQRVLDSAKARNLHCALDEFAERSLPPGGLLIVFRPPNFAAPKHLELLEKRTVDAGGFKVDLLVARKRGFNDGGSA